MLKLKINYLFCTFATSRLLILFKLDKFKTWNCNLTIFFSKIIRKNLQYLVNYATVLYQNNHLRFLDKGIFIHDNITGSKREKSSMLFSQISYRLPKAWQVTLYSACVINHAKIDKFIPNNRTPEVTWVASDKTLGKSIISEKIIGKR